MPVGTCKLCLQTRELHNSHLIPAAMYRIIRKTQGQDPIVMTRGHAGTSSRQVRAYELCWDCEQRLNTGGENWMATQVYRGKEFPLLERLKLALADYETPTHAGYSASAVGIDTDKLVHFGTGVLWKASLRPWIVRGPETTTVDLGPYQTKLREFLLGIAPFPPDGSLIVTVCTDFPSQGCFFAPCTVRDAPIPAYTLLILGVHFRFFLSSAIPTPFQQFCCVHSPRKRIIVADHTVPSMQSFGHLLSTKPEASLRPLTP